MDDPERRPRVFIHEDTLFRSASLSQIVEEAGCELAWEPEERDLYDALEEVLPPLDLIIFLLDSESRELLESLAKLRRRDWLASVPILAVSSLDRSQLDLWQLRALGVVGLIDSGAPAEHVRFRVGQAAWKAKEGRRFERAPCCIPVELNVDGDSLTAYAVSLSVGGLGLASPRAIEPNTLVHLRFALEEGEKPISISGRTVHLREVHRTGAQYEVGLFFLDLPDSLYTDIGFTVSRLLAAWDAVRNMDLDRPEGARSMRSIEPDRS